MPPPTVSPELARAIEQAADWYARVADQPPQAPLPPGLQRWLAANPVHAQAWARVEQVRQRFGQVPAGVAAPVLRQPPPRRAALRTLAGLAATTALGSLAYQHAPWREWQADLRTRTGQQQQLTLTDGTRLILNTQSAVDIRFDDQQRQLYLLAGEILVETGPQQDARPFVVQTPQGSVRALGTRFTVRLMPSQAHVQVLQDAVEIRPWRAPAQALRLEAGQQATFDAHHTDAPQPLPAQADAWAHGQLSVLDWPLHRLLEELGRYRPGYLGCADAIAQVRVSGVFPLADTDAALAVLADGFPVKIERLTRYWTRVVPH